VRLVEQVTTGFAVILISFILYVTFFDFKRMPLFKSMFNRKATVEQADKPADDAGAVEQPVPAKP
jgi:hypothetical protein